MPRPFRRSIEETTERVPRGPLGFLGEGNAVGAAGVALVEVVGIFVPGDELDPGFSIESQSVTYEGDKDIHTLVINAASKNVARFASKFRAAPSNIDFVLEHTDVTSIEVIRERPTFNTYRVVVEVSER